MPYTSTMPSNWIKGIDHDDLEANVRIIKQTLSDMFTNEDTRRDFGRYDVFGYLVHSHHLSQCSKDTVNFGVGCLEFQRCALDRLLRTHHWILLSSMRTLLELETKSVRGGMIASDVLPSAVDYFSAAYSLANEEEEGHSRMDRPEAIEKRISHLIKTLDTPATEEQMLESQTKFYKCVNESKYELAGWIARRKPEKVSKDKDLKTQSREAISESLGEAQELHDNLAALLALRNEDLALRKVKRELDGYRHSPPP